MTDILHKVRYRKTDYEVIIYTTDYNHRKGEYEYGLFKLHLLKDNLLLDCINVELDTGWLLSRTNIVHELLDDIKKLVIENHRDVLIGKILKIEKENIYTTGDLFELVDDDSFNPKIYLYS